ncbi:MAG: hypothetical protein CM15mP115_05160 [Alphaproteobacteria bacterium]|nr:MAG: hypothetical protein CM15mP115_05160 [Alphaproteobacteria bacterium]
MSLRAFNHRPDQTKGATTVTELPDIKNIIDVPGHGEMERESAKALPEADLMAILKDVPADTIASITERLQYTAQRVADAKTQIMAAKGVKPLERALENAIESGNETMAETIRNKIDNFVVNPVVPKEITDIDVAAPISTRSARRGRSRISSAVTFSSRSLISSIFPSTGTPTISATSSRRASTAA